MYLAVTRHAHREYLTGPFPDRDAYMTVERDAWVTYYAAGRDAWKTYGTAMDATAEPKPAPRPESNPYPPAGLSVGSSAHWPTMRDVSPTAVRDESALSADGIPRPGPDLLSVYAALEARYGLNCLECSFPWRQPSPACPRLVNDVHPAGAGTQTGKADHPSASLGFPGSAFPMFTPRPESER
jgi:hypothetical protein